MTAIFKSWDHKLDLSDVFYDETRTFKQRRDEIVRRIKATAWFKAADAECDFTLTDTIEGLTEALDTDEFDAMWADFYDWCDDGKRVWVVTR